jgi:hypothetical protein
MAARGSLAITAAVLFLIILGGLVIYGATNLKTVSVLDDGPQRRAP